MDWSSRRIHTILEASLLEDRATSDATTALTIDPALRASATVLAKEDCVISGLGCIAQYLQTFAQLEGYSSPHMAPRFDVIHHPEIFDGVRVKRGQSIAVIRHNARAILACERVILNMMQRMSGVATLTQQYVKAVAGTGAKILDTRKTIPGLRVLDKYAVTCGGGMNHRLDLSDGILIKNNHISLGGGLKTVLEKALARRKPGQVVQVEVRTFDELTEALRGGAESILLDNLSVADTKRAVKQVRSHSAGIPIEASGGMRLDTVREYAMAGVDYISVGALTHSATAVDMSMRITADIY
jgi:nicotinate-nucleotide pyrophosphorylase (carboxylating)